VTAPGLILASRSKRRAILLAEAGYRFEQVDPPFEDPPSPDGDDPAATAVALARAKVASTAMVRGVTQRSGPVILSADTIVVIDGRLLGQPRDRREAESMLNGLQGRDHRVVTGVALLGGGQDEQTLVDVAEVRFGPLRCEERSRYLDSGLWRGKAGAYNLAEVQDLWAVEVEGDSATVMGLPLRRLRPILERLSIEPKPDVGPSSSSKP
jgi:septum formation protein